MATIVLGAVGAAIGASVGGPAGAWKGWQIGSVVGSIVDYASMPKQEVGKLTDLRVGGSSYGSAYPRAWGNVRVPGTVVWLAEDASGNHLKEHRKSVGGGGGSGGGSATQYTYSATMAVAFAQTVMYARDPLNPLGGSLIARPATLKRLWMDDSLVYDSARTDNLLDPDEFTWHGGSETQAPDPVIVAASGGDASKVNAFRGLCYIVLPDKDLSPYGNRVPNFSAEIETDGPIHLSDIFSDYCRMVGLQAFQIDATAGSDTAVLGLVESNRSSPNGSIGPLCQFYGFDVVDVDGVLKLVKRGGPAVATIPVEALGASSGDAVTKMTRTRVLQSELPGVMEVSYFDKDLNHQNGLQRDIRQSADIYNVQTIQLPVTMYATEATAGSQRMMDTAWTEIESYAFTLPVRWLKLCPGDVVNLPVNGRSLRARLTDLSLGPISELHCKAVLDGQQVVSTVGGGDTGGSIIGGNASIVPSEWYAWSGTELRNDDQTSAGFYVAATGAEGWRGGTVYWSADGGTTWVMGPSVTGSSVWGVATSALGSSGAVKDTFDDVNTVGVDVSGTGGELQSTDDNSITSGGVNHALLGDEILAFGSADITGTGLYTLSHLRRGERGTPMTGHVSGERFVALTPSLTRVPVAESLVGQTVRVKVVSYGQTLVDVTSYVSVTIAPRTPTATETIISTYLVPHFINPVDIVADETGTVDWFTVTGASYLPSSARLVILECEWSMFEPDTGDVDARVWVRSSSASSAYLLARGRSSGSSDNCAGANQAMFPLAPDQTFQVSIEAPGFDNGATVRIVGYWGTL